MNALKPARSSGVKPWFLTLALRFGVGEVNLGVRHIEIAAEDYGFLLFQFFEVAKKIAVPLLAIGEAGEFALGVGHINVHEKELGELRGEHAALVVVFGDANASRDVRRARAGEDGGAGVALFPGAVPIGRIVRRPELFDIVGAALGFLEAEHVRLLGVEILEKIFPQHRAQAVDVPRNQLHGPTLTRCRARANPTPLKIMQANHPKRPAVQHGNLGWGSKPGFKKVCEREYNS